MIDATNTFTSHEILRVNIDRLALAIQFLEKSKNQLEDEDKAELIQFIFNLLIRDTSPVTPD